MGAFPQIADWNEDGKKDLLVGDTDGGITLFINVGTNSSPVLSNNGFIQAGSSKLDVGSRAAPVVVDWNNDGKKDLVIGNDNGYIRLYINSGSNASPQFTTFTNLMVAGSNIMHYRSSPEVFDLNGDGKKDLLVGDWYGYYHFYSNTGSDKNPIFTTAETVMIDTEPPQYMWVDESAKFDLADWDEDGDMDIISGEWNAYVNLFTNTTPLTTIDDHITEIPSLFFLKQNYPNPFNPATSISYTVPKYSMVNISVYNNTGQLVTTLVNEYKNPGTYSIEWHAAKNHSGVYFYRLTTAEFSAVKKCVIVK
jgi:hypothetical protein